MECPVCRTVNDEFAVVCIKCRGFLQNRIPNLDLFETLWLVIERPYAAFRRITLAEHKNYAGVLFLVCGIGLAFALLSVFAMGDRFSSLLEVIGLSIIAGFALGLFLFSMVPLIHWLLCRIAGGKGAIRNSLGLTAYALTPMIIATVLLTPIALATFGMYLFTHNPHPLTIKPEVYVILLGLFAMFAGWSLVLLGACTRVGFQVSVAKAAAVAVATAVAMAAGLYGIGLFLTRLWV